MLRFKVAIAGSLVATAVLAFYPPREDRRQEKSKW